MSCIRKVSHYLHRAIESAEELICPPTKQIPSLEAREMTTVYLIQLEPADGMGKAELLIDGAVQYT